MLEKTLAIIKPDAIAAGNTGIIITLIERNKFDILKMHKDQLTRKDAEEFYAVHKERPFFNELVETMISGPVIIMALERDNAISAWRDLMGATDPKKAAIGTIRYMFAEYIGKNATHGSDSPETAKVELGFFYPEL